MVIFPFQVVRWILFSNKLIPINCNKSAVVYDFCLTNLLPFYLSPLCSKKKTCGSNLLVIIYFGVRF